MSVPSFHRTPDASARPISIWTRLIRREISFWDGAATPSVFSGGGRGAAFRPRGSAPAYLAAATEPADPPPRGRDRSAPVSSDEPTSAADPGGAGISRRGAP